MCYICANFAKNKQTSVDDSKQDSCPSTPNCMPVITCIQHRIRPLTIYELPDTAHTTAHANPSSLIILGYVEVSKKFVP
jgi:uncharacterized protein (DUF1499 family)